MPLRMCVPFAMVTYRCAFNSIIGSGSAAIFIAGLRAVAFAQAGHAGAEEEGGGDVVPGRVGAAVAGFAAFPELPGGENDEGKGEAGEPFSHRCTNSFRRHD